jgi:hypothetical protein
MDATLYTGTNVSNVIVNQGQFKPDLVWLKVRSTTGYHGLIDSVRGRAYSLFSNATDAEGTSTATQDLVSFNSNGFTVGVGSQFNSNGSGNTLVGWQWQAGQGTNTSGTGTGGITSVSYSVSTTAGFSVVIYTGSGSVGTVTHGLGVAPRMVIVKSRSAGSTDWIVYHASLGATQNVRLQSTAAAATQTAMWNDTAPTSTVFTIGTNNNVNTNAQTQVAYCWAEIAGFSKFGSYTGNGNADGPFVYLGFRPEFIMVKSSSSVTDWNMWDTSRSPYNQGGQTLWANLTNAEYTAAVFYDILSNGFKLRDTNAESNANTQTYIYMAFAENPFKNSNAR